MQTKQRARYKLISLSYITVEKGEPNETLISRPKIERSQIKGRWLGLVHGLIMGIGTVLYYV